MALRIPIALHTRVGCGGGEMASSQRANQSLPQDADSCCLASHVADLGLPQGQRHCVHSQEGEAGEQAGGRVAQTCSTCSVLTHVGQCPHGMYVSCCHLRATDVTARSSAPQSWEVSTQCFYRGLWRTSLALLSLLLPSLYLGGSVLQGKGAFTCWFTH